MNVASFLDTAAKFFPEKPALIQEDRVFLYSELRSMTDRLARGLRNLGLEQGDRAAIFLPNLPEFAVVYYALEKLGVIAVSLNAMLKKEEVRYILEDSGSRIVFTTIGLSGEVPDDGLDRLENRVLVDGTADGFAGLESLMDGSDEPFPVRQMDRDDPAAILYTSGTTGFPKGAVLTHGNVIFNSHAAVYHTRMTSGDVLQLFLPLFHCFGQNFILNSGFLAGASVLIHQRFEPGSVLKAMKTHGATMFFAVPTIYIGLLAMEVPASDLSSLRYCFTAAANMPPEVARRWSRNYGLTINDGYGLTESSPFASYNHDFAYRHGTIGSPVMNVEMSVRDAEGREVTDGDWGEICIKGPNVMKGYWNRPEATSAAIRNGWLFTGDIGTRDADGYFRIVDRVKDMINVAGNKIYPAEVENVLFQHPAVHEAAVFGMPDPEKGERVKAAVVLTADGEVAEADIIEFCRSRMAVYKAPREVVFVRELPKSPTGKILKRILRQEQM